MANPEHVDLVKRGAAAIAAWRREHPAERLDLSGADLRRADLSGAYLSETDLSGADLSETDLRGAYLRGAYLRAAHLSGANLDGANLTNSRWGFTSLGDVDLRGARGLETARHFAPSSIGVDTLVSTLRGAGGRFTTAQRTFFVGAGVSQGLLDALPRILAEIKYHSCFISYGQPDLEFAQGLYKDLKAKGVPCWLYALDATPGERTWGEIGKKRREAGKVVILCSAQALVRDGVLKEIEEQIDEDPDKIVPISLDDFWKESGFRVMRSSRDLKPFLLDRNYADFANLPFEEALERLLRALALPSWPLGAA